MAEIHPQLQQDCMHIGRLTLCHVLVMKDANYPWCILVPDREGVREIYELTPHDQQIFIQESSILAAGMATEFKADKMNIAALGNIVPQLHIHHIVRYQSDIAWPSPVWGRHPAKPYTETGLIEMNERITRLLGSHLQRTK